MLEARDLRLERGGRTVLAGLSARFAPGRVSVVLGPNGAGKSTLAEALAGLLPPADGELLWQGAPLAAMAPGARARAIGYLAQNGGVHWNLSVAETVALGRLPHGRRPAGRDPAVERALAAAGCTELSGRRVHELSGGERARVLLARVLAGEPALVIADEPLANLDPRHQLEALALLRAAADAGAAVVLVLHDLAAAGRVADRLLLLAHGRLLAEGTPADVLDPRLLGEAYDTDMAVRPDPELGWIVAPIPRSPRAEGS